MFRLVVSMYDFLVRFDGVDSCTELLDGFEFK